MFGSIRPFAFEIKEPRIRKLDFKQVEEDINKINEGKTLYHDFHPYEKSREAKIKKSSPDVYKAYNAIVKCEVAFVKDNLEELRKLNEINQ